MRLNLFFVFTIIFLTPIVGQADSPMSPKYSVQQHGNIIVLNYPGGQRVYVGSQNFSSEQHYRFRIPIPDLPNSEPIENQLANSEGISPIRKPKKSNPLDIEAMLARANRCYFRGEMNNANDIVDTIIFSDRKNVRTWTMKGSLMRALGRRDLAQKAWNYAKRLDPDNPFLRKIEETDDNQIDTPTVIGVE